MIVMGDEVRRTQRGNNNAYGLDDETSWFDWMLLERHADVHRFVSLLAARRALRDPQAELERIDLTELLRRAPFTFSGISFGQPDWSDVSHSLALTAELQKEKLLVHAILNAYWGPLEFELPPARGGPGSGWRRWIDTALDSPDDIVRWRSAPLVPGSTYRAEARSVVALFAST